MKPLPVPTDLIEAWNADADEPKKFARITMLPPGPMLPDGTPCDPVEVIVESRAPADDDERNAVLAELLRRGVDKRPDELRIPTRFYVRVGVSERDVRLIERAGMFWLSVWGAGFSPFAVWAEDGDEGERPMAERLAALEGLVREVVKREPTTGDMDDCAFCGEPCGIEHTPECWLVRARALIA